MGPCHFAFTLIDNIQSQMERSAQNGRAGRRTEACCVADQERILPVGHGGSWNVSRVGTEDIRGNHPFGVAESFSIENSNDKGMVYADYCDPDLVCLAVTDDM